MKKILDHRWTSNIAAFLNLLAAIIVPIGLYILQKSDVSGSKSDTNSPWSGTETFLVIIICVLLLIYGVSLINFHAHRSRIEVIRKLTALQESHILAPHYITAMEHADCSKEGALSRGGSAHILTNSLKYDRFYSAEIAKNIVKGAKYTYILPDAAFMITDLQDYIAAICNSIHAELQSQEIADVLSKFNELCLNNLEFWFFNNGNLCLYNYAIFRQTPEGGSQPFTQYWWYINPANTQPNSPMITYEITDRQEIVLLDEVFKILKSRAMKKNGKEVSDNRSGLGDWIGGAR